MDSGSHVYDWIYNVCTVVLVTPLLCYLSYRTVVVIWCAALLLWLLVRWRRQRKWRFHMGGSVEPGFEKVEQVFRCLLETRQELGAGFCVYYEGRPVVDLWGGYADHSSLRLRTDDNTQMFYSASKAVTAVVMAVLVERGLLDYNAPISHYWPEFGQNGKEDIQVKTLLSHQAGVITIKEKHKLSLVRDDPTELSRLLAKQVPMWEPGKGQGYHTLTYGLYADQIVRRVDPHGRSLSKFFDQEIAKPFGLEFWIGEPISQFHRGCKETRIYFGIKYFFHTVIPTSALFVSRAAYHLLRYGKIYLLYFVGNPTDWKPRRMNDPAFRSIPSPASHGFGTVHSAAKLMGILGNGGSHKGKTLISPKICHQLNSELSHRLDRVVMRHIKYGPGMMLYDVEQDTNPHTIFGHWGAGGQMMFSDLHHRLGWAYATNFGNMLHGFIMDHRYKALQDALYECIAKVDS